MEKANVPIKRRVTTNEIFAPARKTFPRRKIIQRGISDTWQVDLIEFCSLSRQNDGYKYALMCIDVFSKKAFARALKSKRSKEVADAMETIFEESGVVPKNIHVSVIIHFRRLYSYQVFHIFFFYLHRQTWD